MKPISSLVRDNIKNLKPCVHGAEVLGASEESGLLPHQILDFSSSVNPLGPSKKALNAAKEAFAQIPAYPDSNSNELRQVIASHYGLNKGQVIVGNGSTELMYLFAEVFMKKSDRAVIPAPTFGEYASAICKTGEATKYVKLDKTFALEPESFKREMVGAKLVFLCNPNNPTSMLIPQETLKDIIEAALAKNTLVFLDEDFLEFVEAEKSLSMINKIEKYPNLFILRSFTKIFGLTGLRVGYGIANQEIINVLSSAKIPWNVNCIAQAAAVAALKDDEHLRVTIELIRGEKERLIREFAQFTNFKFSLPDANFFFIDVRKSGFTAAELKSKMLKKGILIRDCSSFEGLDEFYIRVAVKTPQENDLMLSAFRSIVKAV
ncbi:MAG: threonine-phosphate decarboxylase CobD [Ignavibacteria bacterium]